MRQTRRDTTKRSYRPKVEALEALRLLDAGLLPSALAVATAEYGATLANVESSDTLLESGPSGDAWDAALGQSDVGDLLARDTGTPVAIAQNTDNPLDLDTEPQSEAIQSGLNQLTRYLGRAWACAGIDPQSFEDCTQEVYETLLSNLGRDGFDQLAAQVGVLGVRNVLSRETPDGPGFFRAVDMVKKRTQRTRSFQSLDEHYLELADGAGTDGASATDWRRELDEAIDRSLTRREADLIRDTLMGKTPQEIAQTWGMAAKTVSNEKTRAIQKLRVALTDGLDD